MCVRWVTPQGVYIDMLQGLRFTTSDHEVWRMWIQWHLLKTKLKCVFAKMIFWWLTVYYDVNMVHLFVSSRPVALRNIIKDPWNRLRLCSSLKYVLWHACDPLTTWNLDFKNVRMTPTRLKKHDQINGLGHLRVINVYASPLHHCYESLKFLYHLIKCGPRPNVF